MKRILFVVLSIFCCATLYAQTKKPNLILFIVDDMGLMDTSVPFLFDGKGTDVSISPMSSTIKRIKLGFFVCA